MTSVAQRTSTFLFLVVGGIMLAATAGIPRSAQGGWLEKGAVATESVKAILEKEGLLKVPTTTN